MAALAGAVAPACSSASSMPSPSACRACRSPGIGEVPVQLIQALPYILTVILLAGFVGKAMPPQGRRHALCQGALMAGRDRFDRRCRRPRARTPMRPIPASRSAPRSATSRHASMPAAMSRTPAYPQGTCAPRPARSRAMVLAGGKQDRRGGGRGGGRGLVTPCGGCRQKFREFCAGDVLEFHICDVDGTVKASFTLAGLLPSFLWTGASGVRTLAEHLGAGMPIRRMRNCSRIEPWRDRLCRAGFARHRVS